MAITFIDAEMIRKRLPMAQCIEAMARAMAAVSDGRAVTPPRLITPLADGRGFLALMPGSVRGLARYGAKVVSVHPENAEAGRPVIQGFVALFDSDTGEVVAIVNGAEITALRTGAVSGLASRLLAREDASSLGLIGCGVQATTHLQAMSCVRKIGVVRVWGRSQVKARKFVEQHQHMTSATLLPVADARQAAECDIVCVVTSAAEPVIEGAWLKPGSHINLVGAHAPDTRESDSALIRMSRVFVDCRQQASREAGDILIPLQQGVINHAHLVGEIGEVLLGRIEGRRNAQEITVFKSLGLVSQDLLAAQAVLDNSHN